MAGVATPNTGELGLSMAVAFVHKATMGAGPARMTRINQHQGNTQALGFVDEKLPQLPEAPTVLLIALAFANRHPVAYPGQLFQGQRGLRVFGMRHKLFRDRMVHIPAKPRFLWQVS